jgi:hypothetical protein
MCSEEPMGFIRTQDCLFFFSNLRIGYLKALQAHVPVDFYGLCGEKTCPKEDPSCLSNVVKDYKFYLAFENRRCRDYVTEKFFSNALGYISPFRIPRGSFAETGSIP